MLGESPIGNRVSEVFRIADCARDVDPSCWMTAADIGEQPRQILLQMAALGKEQRNHGNVPDALTGQARDRRGQVRLHNFQERQLHAQGGLFATQSCRDAPKRLRPRRIAGAVGKQKNGRRRFRVQWSAGSSLVVFHRKAQRRKGNAKKTELIRNYGWEES